MFFLPFALTRAFAQFFGDLRPVIYRRAQTEARIDALLYKVEKQA
jgi:hypothetical protein